MNRAAPRFMLRFGSAESKGSGSIQTASFYSCSEFVTCATRRPNPHPAKTEACSTRKIQCVRRGGAEGSATRFEH